jgi:hypothetical protein
MLVAGACMAAGLLPAALAASVTYDLSVRSETRGRVTPTSGRSGEITADPRGELTAATRTWSLSGAYAPQLTLPSDPATLNVLHSGTVSATWRFQPRWTADASGSGSYGERDFLFGQTLEGAPAPAGGPQTLPTLRSLEYGAGALTLGVRGTPTARTRTRASLRGFVDGGATALARTAMPLQRGATLSTALDWTASRADVLSTSLDATITDFSGGRRDGAAALLATWRRELSTHVNAWIGAGPTLMSESRAGTADRTQVAVGGEAGVLHRLTRPALDSSITLRVAPVVDRVTAAVHRRADATATSAWHPKVHWTVSGTVSAGVVVDGPQRGDDVETGELRVAWARGLRWGLAGGARFVRQDSARALVPDVREWIAFVAITAHQYGRLSFD